MRRAAVASVALAVVLADRLSKWWVLGTLRPGDEISVVGTMIRFVHGENRGGLFGLLQGSALLLVPLSAAVVVALLVAHERESAQGPTLLTLGVGALIGGAVGNAIDRVSVGYVLDFVDIGAGALRFWTFNVADVGITSGIAILAADALHLGRRRDRAARDAHE
jgi:signal peptidase II